MKFAEWVTSKGAESFQTLQNEPINKHLKSGSGIEVEETPASRQRPVVRPRFLKKLDGGVSSRKMWVWWWWGFGNGRGVEGKLGF